MGSSGFKEASDVKKLAKKFISEIHTNLDGVHIEFVFTDDVLKENKKEQLTKIEFVSGVNAWLATREGQPIPEFVVLLINRENWNIVNDDMKSAEIDHRLMQIMYDRGKGTLSKRPFDVLEFGEVVQRHGEYNTDLKDFLKRARNPKLFDDIPSIASLEASVAEEADEGDGAAAEESGEKKGRKKAAKGGNGKAASSDDAKSARKPRKVTTSKKSSSAAADAAQ